MFEAVYRLWQPKEEQDELSVHRPSEQPTSISQDKDSDAARFPYDSLVAQDVGDYA